MSRQIKFRAWDKKREEMLTVKLMDFSEWWVSCDPTYGQAKPLDYGERNSFANQDTDRHILMQYTGLHDRNGKEIYEGDVVHCWGGEYCQGVWEHDVIIEIKDLTHDCLMMGEFEFLKVIGNIYENGPPAAKHEGPK